MLPIQALSVPKASLPSDRHGFRQAVEPCLHLVQDAFVLPAFDAFDLIGRALRLQRARRAGCKIAVDLDIVLAVRAHGALGQMFACGAGVAVMLGVVDKVLPAK